MKLTVLLQKASLEIRIKNFVVVDPVQGIKMLRFALKPLSVYRGREMKSLF